MDYYGLDWILLAMGLATKYLTIHQNRWSFVTSIVSCLAGLAVAIMAGQYGIAVFNVILIAMSFQGFALWSKSSTPKPQAQPIPTTQTHATQAA